MSMDPQHEYAESHPTRIEADYPDEPYTGRVDEPEEPVYTVAEAAWHLEQAQAYSQARPTSRFGAGSVLHWERVLAEATAREAYENLGYRQVKGIYERNEP